MTLFCACMRNLHTKHVEPHPVFTGFFSSFGNSLGQFLERHKPVKSLNIYSYMYMMAAHPLKITLWNNKSTKH